MINSFGNGLMYQGRVLCYTFIEVPDWPGEIYFLALNNNHNLTISI